MSEDFKTISSCTLRGGLPSYGFQTGRSFCSFPIQKGDEKRGNLCTDFRWVVGSPIMPSEGSIPSGKDHFGEPNAGGTTGLTSRQSLSELLLIGNSGSFCAIDQTGHQVNRKRSLEENKVKSAETRFPTNFLSAARKDEQNCQYGLGETQTPMVKRSAEVQGDSESSPNRENPFPPAVRRTAVGFVRTEPCYYTKGSQSFGN